MAGDDVDWQSHAGAEVAQKLAQAELAKAKASRELAEAEKIRSEASFIRTIYRTRAGSALGALGLGVAGIADAMTNILPWIAPEPILFAAAVAMALAIKGVTVPWARRDSSKDRANGDSTRI